MKYEYDIAPYGDGVELSSTSLHGLVEGIIYLVVNNYEVQFDSIQQSYLLYFVDAVKSKKKESLIKEENQKIIDMTLKIDELNNILEEKIKDLTDAMNEVKKLKDENRLIKAANTRLEKKIKK